MLYIQKESPSTAVTAKLFVKCTHRLQDIPQGLWQQEGDLAQEITNALTRAAFTACPALAAFYCPQHISCLMAFVILPTAAA